MEYLDYPLLNWEMRNLNPEQKLTLAVRLANTLDGVHKCNVMHRDVHTRNIFVTYDSKNLPIPILFDFNVAQKFGECDSLNSLGFIRYAPEFRDGFICPTPSSEVYSIGLLLCIMFNPKLDWWEIANNPKFHFPKNINPLLSKSLDKDPYKRFQSMEELNRCFRRSQPTKRLNPVSF